MELPRRPETQATERVGVNFVRSVIEAENCLFHEIAAGNDYGNDAFVELVSAGRVTGVCIAFQIKSGRSYCTTTTCEIPYTERQANYWRGHSLPVYGVVYDPEESRAYWTILSRAIKPSTTGSGKVILSKSALGQFDRINFREILLPFLLKEPPALELARAIIFANSEDADEHRVGVQSLFFGYRNSVDAWARLETLLLARPRDKLHVSVCTSFAHIVGHGDIFWSRRNQIDDVTRKEVRSKMRTWGEEHVVKLLEFVDENGTERGTIGQNVHAVLRGIDNVGEVLRRIAFSAGRDPKVRETALFVYVDGFAADSDIDRVLPLAEGDPVLADMAYRFREFLQAAR